MDMVGNQKIVGEFTFVRNGSQLPVAIACTSYRMRRNIIKGAFPLRPATIAAFFGKGNATQTFAKSSITYRCRFFFHRLADNGSRKEPGKHQRKYLQRQKAKRLLKFPGLFQLP